LNVHGKAVDLLATAIDSGGHHTQAVYGYARAHQHEHVLAVKGQSQTGKPIIGKPTQQDVNWRGEKVKRGVKLWPIGTDTAKAEIYGRLRIATPGAGFVLLSKHLPAEVFEQITSERLVTRYIKGRARLEWVLPGGKSNEDLDCAVYALACAMWGGMDRWRDADWARLEKRLLPEMPSAPSEEPAEVKPQPAATMRRKGRRRGTIGAGMR
jgi:terminase, large subunit